MDEMGNPLTQHYLIKKTIKVENDPTMVGDGPIHFDADGKIIIDGLHSKGTTGLYGLLFKRLPKDGAYIEAYTHIFENTDAHRRW